MCQFLSRLSRRLRTIVAAAGFVGVAASAAAQTHTVRLIAAPFGKSVTLPNGQSVVVPMWGFALDANGDGVLDPSETPTVPGPRITVPAGTATLEIYVTNQLSGPGAEPISLVVPGQAFSASPVRAGDRVVSMTTETAVGATEVYRFTDLKPGTFLYQSATHQAVQVQMGLYGAVTMDAAAGQAYTGVAYDHEALLVYSEIDVALHNAVAAGTYGHPDLGGPTSTIDYDPSLFLVNGESYANELTPSIDAGNAGQRTLLRLLNAGLKTHVPVLLNSSVSLVAEDGHPYSFARPQDAVMLAAGKTHDAVWMPSSAGLFSLYDRMLNLTAADQGAGGMLAKLKVGAGATDPAPSSVAVNDSYGTTEDAALVVTVGGVLANDASPTTAELVTGTHAGALTLQPDGSFSYTPSPNFFGVDSFTYRTNGSAPAMVTISVAPVADMPSALAQTVGVDAKDSVRVRLTGSDPDGDALTFYLRSLPSHGTLSIIDPVTSIERILTAADLNTTSSTGTAIPSALVIYTPSATPTPYSGPDAFQFVASDAPGRLSAAAGVDATVRPLVAEETLTGTPVTLNVVGSDGAAVSGYRWTMEEDRTYKVVPGIADPATLSVSFHASYMPVRQSGDETTKPIADPAKRYFISVLPKTGAYTNGGAELEAGRTMLKVVVNKGPIPTARIRVRVFEDNAPLNGVWDSEEAGLPGFEVTIDDAGGRYGMSGGHQSTDAFGNPIGTTYVECSTGPGTCDSYEVAHAGDGYVLSDAEGYAVIENLPPGKYTVKVRPRGGETWIQTSTIEGQPGIDAWVKANEPQFFTEFGPPGPHVFVGFVRATTGAGVLGVGPGPFSTITGRVTNMRMSRPPDASSYSGAPFDFTTPWVALNSGATGGTLLYTQPTAEDGTFSIAGVPSGSYQLVVYDSALDLIIGSTTINVSAPTATALGDVPAFQWFTRSYHYVFEDTNENGFRDEGERGIPDTPVNIRWRDGSMYQSSATDTTGFVPFEEVFPFFAWQIAEVDFARFKATGVTVVIDNGGATDVNTSWPGLVGADLDPAILAPQPQSENGGAPYRTETGSPLILLEAFQGFIGQSNVMLWGKAPYAPSGSVVPDVNVAPFDDFPGPGDTDGNGNGRFDVDVYHGGITGVVHYSTTRAENDPRWGTPEPWEPGVPGVKLQLWDAARTHLLNEVVTDSWDASQPEGCQGQVFTYLGRATDCYDGLRNFNQVRPGVFDGGYYFGTILSKSGAAGGHEYDLPIDQRDVMTPIPAGKYVVKVVVPNGYKIVKEEDKNVDFGEEYIPQQFYLTGYPLADAGAADAQPKTTVDEYPLAVPFCVGTLHEVPQTLALFPGAVNGAYGGESRPLCDAKLVTVRDGANAAANFFVFTEAPIAGHIYGFVLDDTTNESDPNAPTFGEKYAPPFMPVSLRDWTGREIGHTYTDQYGTYNMLVPSTFTAAVPQPSGMSPSMLSACINSPTMVGPDGTTIPDPHFHKEYSHFCYTLQYMPGTTTYLDTPVVPTGAFTGNGSFPVDAELADKTPIIASVNGSELNLGPYVVDRGGANAAARTIVIKSVGNRDVPNPRYDGAGGTQPKLVTRDYGFGPATPGGFVTLGGQRINVTSWTNDQITAVVPSGAGFRTGELAIERCMTAKTGTGASQTCADNRKSILGVTLNVATPQMHTARPPRTVSQGQSIQAAIDAARPGDLILVQPGTYEQMVVMTKPVRLQGAGAMSTILSVVTTPAEGLQQWLDYTGNLLLANPSYLLPGQPAMTPAPFQPGDVTAVLGGEAAGVTVLGKNLPTNDGTCQGTFANPANEAYCLHNENTGGAAVVLRPNARIDGFTIIGANSASGVMVNGYARSLEISNNRIYNNTGDFAGGIDVGHTGAALPLADTDAMNRNIAVHNNMVGQNAGIEAGGGGGIVLGTGSAGYQVTNNFIAGNFTGGQGAGIAHIGLSEGGVIDRNLILFNESFSQGVGTNGGGIYVGGRAPTAGTLTPGSGSVRISNNLVLGNQAAGGDGGGIALQGVNGLDAQQIANPNLRYRVNLFNNVVVNNEAALAGGGISLEDAAYVQIVHNTIAHNDSLATAGAAFSAGPRQSVPQPAGIVSRGHTPLLAQALGSSFSDPTIVNSIVWENRSFYFGPQAGGVVIIGDPAPAPTTYGLIANAAQPYWDLGVLGAPAGSRLHPSSSVLTNTSGYPDANTSSAPSFIRAYFNGDRRMATLTGDTHEITLGIQAPAAFDEGGNFIRPQFGPLTLNQPNGDPFGNYHVTAGMGGQALNLLYGNVANVPAPLLFDIDGDTRPTSGPVLPHRGADQAAALAPPPPPTTASVSVTGPANNATVGGTITIYAAAPGIANVARLDFLVNGVVVGSDNTASDSYYTVPWNTRGVSDTTSTATQAVIRAIAYDSAGNATPSADVRVNVRNLGLVASYDFNEAVGTTVNDGAFGVGNDVANNGTFPGGGGIVRTGDRSAISGGALWMSGLGGNFITVPDPGTSSSLDLTSAMTLEAWVRPESVTGWINTILKDSGTAGTGVAYSLYANSDTDGGAGTYARTTAVGSDMSATAPTRLTTNAWHHLAAVFTSNTLILYVDGREVARTTGVAGTLVQSNGALSIGGNARWGELFTGLIDDVKIYNRALSSSEISADAASPSIR